MYKKLLHIRLSTFSILLFIGSLIFLKYYQQTTLTPGQLALFSVNSFLFGYYFAPLLGAQKARVGQLNTVARQETMVLLDILAQSHLLSEKTRKQLKLKLAVYLESVLYNKGIQADNPYYDELLHFTKKIKFPPTTRLSSILCMPVFQKLKRHETVLITYSAPKSIRMNG